jgi:hypothetical protein
LAGRKLLGARARCLYFGGTRSTTHIVCETDVIDDLNDCYARSIVLSLFVTLGEMKRFHPTFIIFEPLCSANYWTS